MTSGTDESQIIYELYNLVYNDLLPQIKDKEKCLASLNQIYSKWINLKSDARKGERKKKSRKEKKSEDILEEYRHSIKEHIDPDTVNYNKACTTANEVFEHIKELDNIYSLFANKSLTIAYYIGKYLCYLQLMIGDDDFSAKVSQLKYSKNYVSFLKSFYRFLVIYPKFLNCHVSLYEFKEDFSKLKKALNDATLTEIAFWKNV